MSNEQEPISLKLFKLALNTCEFLKSTENEIYAKNDYLKHYVPIKDSMFRNWLIYLYFNEFQRTLPNRALSEAIENLKAVLSVQLSKRHKVFTRIAHYKNSIIVDLNNEKHLFVEISEEGWRITSSPPVLFVRNGNLEELPIPKTNGNIHNLNHYLNLSEDDFILVLAFILGNYMQTTRYPILFFQGSEGSGKSFRTQLIKKLIDPSVTDSLSLPKGEKDLFIEAKNQHLQAYDNISNITRQQADWLCKLSTNSSISRRKLFKDTDQIHMKFSRPIVLNSINSITQNDLISRLLYVKTPKFKNFLSPEILSLKFNKERPYFLGAIFDLLSECLKNYNKTEVYTSFRFVDFVRWATSCELKLNIGKGEFTKVIENNSSRKAEDALDKNIFVQLIISIITDSEKNYLDVTATELYTQLKHKCMTMFGKEILFSSIPSPNKLKEAILENEKLLNQFNIEFIEGKRSATRKPYIFYKTNDSNDGYENR